jgi:hypothetical protein
MACPTVPLELPLESRGVGQERSQAVTGVSLYYLSYPLEKR